MHILNNLPEAYKTVVEQLKDYLGDEDEPLMVQKLREKLRAKFQ